MSDRSPALSEDITYGELASLLRGLVARSLHCDVHSIDGARPVHTLGIDSLDSADIARTLSAAAGAHVPLTTFLGELSLDQIAETLRQKSYPAEQADASPSVSAASGELSYGQLALWAIHQNAPESSAYNLTYGLKTDVRIQPEPMVRALERLMARHDVLRTSFPTELGKPLAVIKGAASPDFQFSEISDPDKLTRAIRCEAAAPFNLATGPLVRFRLYESYGESSVLLIVIHHIVSDFWSITLLLRDLFDLYSSEMHNIPSQLPLIETQYEDFVTLRARHISGQSGETDWNHWSRALAGQLMPLDLVTDRARPKQPSYHGEVYCFSVGPETTKSLRALSREMGSTLFVTVLSGFFALLHRYTGQDDIIVGVPTSGRDKREWLNTKGYFVNPVALRARFEEEISARKLVGQTRTTVLRAMNHQNYPFPLLVDRLRPRRDPSRSPIFQSMFVWQTQTSGVPEVPAALALGIDGVQFTLNGVSLETISTGGESAQCDLTMSVAELGDELSVALKYSTDLFDRGTAVRMSGHFVTLLGEMSRNMDVPISALTL